ncbi:MAG: DUF3500 domain-containing protein [Saprospiraceae bacterium]|nr:DUF3500 domain-containing protein [Saprospiraceae bacterium]
MRTPFTKPKLWSLGFCTLLIMAFTFKDAPQQTVAAPPIGPSTTQEVIDAANAFKATLSSTQITTCFLSYSLSDAQRWSNFPVGIYNNRIGIKMSELSATQLAAAKNLVKAAAGVGVEGYNEILAIMAADDYLGANGGGSSYTSGNYYIALLGTPALTGTWELYFGGHHLAFANTYKNGALVGGTPSFRSSEPYTEFSQNGSTWEPMKEERIALAAAISGLSATQKTSATLSGSYSDLTLGPQKDWQFPTTKVGLKCSNLDAAQKALVLAAIRTYVADVDSANAAAIMTKYTNDIDNTYFGFVGSGTMVTQGDYVRIDGPSVWLEYSTQGGIVIRTYTHPHTVWRDRTGDYGGTGNPSSVKNVDASVYKMETAPNPTTQQTTLRFTLPRDMSVSIAIYDMTGRMVKAVSKGKMYSGDNNITVDLSHLASGVYTYTLETENGERATKRLVKN